MKVLVALLPIAALAATSAFAPAANAANLISNPGFEIFSTAPRDYASWTEGGFVGAGTPVISGANTASFSDLPSFGGIGGSLFQTFNILPGTTALEFGAKFRVETTALFGNSDRLQITLQVGSQTITIGGNASNGYNSGISFTQTSANTFLTDVFELKGVLPLLASPTTGAININFQNLADPVNRVLVDDAFVQPTAIPTPALLPGLIGFGLGVWRKKRLVKRSQEV
jgi:hypothetical protein